MRKRWAGDELSMGASPPAALRRSPSGSQESAPPSRRPRSRSQESAPPGRRPPTGSQDRGSPRGRTRTGSQGDLGRRVRPGLRRRPRARSTAEPGRVDADTAQELLGHREREHDPGLPRRWQEVRVASLPASRQASGDEPEPSATSPPNDTDRPRGTTQIVRVRAIQSASDCGLHGRRSWADWKTLGSDPHGV